MGDTVGEWQRARNYLFFFVSSCFPSSSAASRSATWRMRLRRMAQQLFDRLLCRELLALLPLRHRALLRLRRFAST
jgi:hypothetical protein